MYYYNKYVQRLIIYPLNALTTSAMPLNTPITNNAKKIDTNGCSAMHSKNSLISLNIQLFSTSCTRACSDIRTDCPYLSPTLCHGRYRECT